MVVETAIKKISIFERGGTGATILATLGFAGAGGYWLYAALTGNVSLTVDQLKTTLTQEVLGTAGAGGLALIATMINVPHLMGHVRMGRGLSTFFSGATLITAALFLFLTLLPKTQLAQFAVSMQDKCQTPLTAITDKKTGDIAKAKQAAANDAGNDTQYIADMTKYAQLFKDDATKAQDAATTLASLKAPNSKYNGLIADCEQQFKDTANFLTGANGITLPPPPTVPAPFGGKSLSAADLLTDSSLLVQGQFPGVKQPIPSFLVSQIVAGVLDSALNTCGPVCHRLTDAGAEADQLKTDTFAPFKPQS